MRKYFVLIIIFLLVGCQKVDTTNSELNDYYLSMTKSSQEGEKVYFQNVTFDFESFDTIESEVIERNSQYPLFVFDKENNRYLYSAKYENGDDHLFIYDMNLNEEMRIDLGIWGINYILVRENDYVVVAVKNFTHILALYSIDKETFSFKEIEIPNDTHDDMSVWQVGYIPQNDGLVIQAYSDEEQYKIYDKWNSEDHKYSEDINIPHYHYILVDGKIEYLFKEDMPQSRGILSNGKEILIAVNSIHKDKNHVLRYDLESKELTTEEHIKNLNAGFYLSDDGKHIFAMGNKIHKFNTSSGEDTILNIKFPFDGYKSNYILVKKQQ